MHACDHRRGGAPEALAAYPEIGTLPRSGSPQRVNLAHDDPAGGLARLVLALVKLLHELLERQAIKRMEGGALTPAQVERVGFTLMRQAQEIDRLRRVFNLTEDDLNIDLGPLGRLV